jgi:acarbose 7IV-phosphotransferase
MVPPIEDFIGHSGHGVAFGCHALGLRTAIADVIGDDERGRLIRRTYDAVGVAVAFQVNPNGTRRSVNLVDRAGRRLSLYDPRPPLDTDVDPAIYEPGIDRARHVHVSIMDWARHALKGAVAAGRSTSTDLHDWDGENEYHRDFAYEADLVFLSTAALDDRADDVVGDILRNGRARAVVAMAGADGCRLTVRGQPTLGVPAANLPDRPVVDSNGAGDSFVAAFLWARLKGYPWERAAVAGAVAGAFACGTFGTHSSFIDRARLDMEMGARSM